MHYSVSVQSRAFLCFTRVQSGIRNTVLRAILLYAANFSTDVCCFLPFSRRNNICASCFTAGKYCGSIGIGQLIIIIIGFNDSAEDLSWSWGAYFFRTCIDKGQVSDSAGCNLYWRYTSEFGQFIHCGTNRFTTIIRLIENVFIRCLKRLRFVLFRRSTFVPSYSSSVFPLVENKNILENAKNIFPIQYGIISTFFLLFNVKYKWWKMTFWEQNTLTNPTVVPPNGHHREWHFFYIRLWIF